LKPVVLVLAKLLEITAIRVFLRVETGFLRPIMQDSS